MGGTNVDHTGASDAPPAATEDAQGERGPLDFSIPTEFVDLPSEGRYYPENHPLHGKETVEIKYMTAKEEDILTSPSLLKKGMTIDRLLRSILMDKTIDPQHLLSGDRNAIIIATRKTGYGEEYKARIGCPACFNTSVWEVNLDDLDITEGGAQSATGYDVVENDDATFTVTLPKSKVKVGVKLFTGREEKALSTAIEKRKKHKLDENNLTEQLRTMIVSVNGSRQISDIERFINFVPAFDSKYLRNTYTKLMPNIDMTSDFECPECSYESPMEVPLTAEFFWPK
tara:strand:+ start:3224 stop:4078 length:855 start_codon:yes stop_codon:yes gene_type:complete